MIINNFILMSSTNHRKVRAVSARPPPGRPSSGKNKKIHQKTQFLDSQYANPLSNFHSFHKNKIFSMRSNMPEIDQEDLSKLMPKGQQMNKDRQQLFEQNLHLKKQVNKLKEQLSKNRTKIENLTSKNQKYTKQFNRQFEKKMYWNGPNSYMISGVKAQYEKAKQELEEKQQECNILKKQLIQSGAPELKVYAATLQEENQKMAEKIRRMAEISEQILLDNQGQNIPEYMYVEVTKKKQKLEDKLEEAEFKIKMGKDQLKEKKRKIQFLQKLIIEKDNSQYHAIKKSKKLQRERNQLARANQQLKEEMQDKVRIWVEKLQKTKITEAKKFESEKNIFDRTLAEKQQKIRSLQKEVAYLSTLLTYWKPLDELNKELGSRKDDSRLGDHNQSFRIEENSKQEILEMNASGMLSMINKKVRKPSENLNASVKGTQFLMNMSRDMEGVKEQKKERKQQTADQRHSDDAEKKRKVNLREVEHLGQHLRYRFLGLRLPLNEVRKFFDWEGQEKEAFILDEDQNIQWQKQYITMKQAKDILMKYPFELNDQQAHLLARYLIEDSDNQYVYCDLNNENKRSIIKSILKSLTGNYQILNQERHKQVQKECETMLQRYESNLISTFTSVASSGVFSRKKFIELINSLGIELSEQGRDFLVCKMLLKSKSLQELDYMVLF